MNVRDALGSLIAHFDDALSAPPGPLLDVAKLNAHRVLTTELEAATGEENACRIARELAQAAYDHASAKQDGKPGDPRQLATLCEQAHDALVELLNKPVT